MIPNTIKTGFDTDTGVSEHVSAVQKKLLAMVILLVRKASMTAAIFCRHQGIEEVDVDHIRKSLKYEGMRFYDMDDLESETANIQAKLEAWDEDTLANDDSVENVVNKVVDEVEEETQDTLQNQSCECDICQALPVIEEQWDAYQPTDEAKRFLRDQIEFIDHTYALET